MAAADTGYDSDEALQNIYQMHISFAEEAFEYLIQKALIYDPTADSSDKLKSTEFPDTSGYAAFSHNIGKAVLVLAHKSRKDHTRIFSEAGDLLRDVSYFQLLAFNHDPTRHNDYIFGYDYTKMGQKCLERIPDMKRFCSEGGWRMLEKSAERTAFYYDDLSEDIAKGLVEVGESQSLVKAVERMQVRDETYIPTKGIQRILKLLRFLHVEESFLYKFIAASTIDLNRVTVGYKIVIKDESMLQSSNSQRVSPKASDVPSDQEADKNECFGVNKICEFKDFKNESFPDDVVEKPAYSESEYIRNKLIRSDTPGSICSQELPWEVDDKKSVFLVSERYIERKDTLLNIDEEERWKYKHAIKIHSPSKGSNKLVKNMFETVQENIENKNYHEVTNQILAICPPGCNLNDDDTRVIVLDTSSDDEETPRKFRPKQWEVMLDSIPAGDRIRKKSLGNIAALQGQQEKSASTKWDESALAKNTGARSKSKKSTIWKDSASEVKQDLYDESALGKNSGVRSKIKKSTLPKGSASKVEQDLCDESALAKNTGARPKVKKLILPKGGASKVKQDLSADGVSVKSLCSGPNNATPDDEKQSKAEKREKRRTPKSKK